MSYSVIGARAIVGACCAACVPETFKVGALPSGLFSRTPPTLAPIPGTQDAVAAVPGPAISFPTTQPGIASFFSTSDSVTTAPPSAPPSAPPTSSPYSGPASDNPNPQVLVTPGGAVIDTGTGDAVTPQASSPSGTSDATLGQLGTATLVTPSTGPSLPVPSLPSLPPAVPMSSLVAYCAPRPYGASCPPVLVGGRVGGMGDVNFAVGASSAPVIGPAAREAILAGLAVGAGLLGAKYLKKNRPVVGTALIAGAAVVGLRAAEEFLAT